MNYQILDLYSDYLLSSFGQTTATGLARMVNNQVSHDQIIRMLSGEKMTAKTWWKMVKPHVRQMQHEEGVIIIDDSIEEKPYSDENDIICWHYYSAGSENRLTIEDFEPAPLGINERTLRIGARWALPHASLTRHGGKGWRGERIPAMFHR